VRAIDLAHAAGPERFDDGIRSETIAGVHGTATLLPGCFSVNVISRVAPHIIHAVPMPLTAGTRLGP